MEVNDLADDMLTINDVTVELITLLVNQGWDHHKIVQACGGVIKLELDLDRVLGKEVPPRTDCN